MEFNSEPEARSYAVIYSIVYQFGKVGLEVGQIREFTNNLGDEVFDVIADSWFNILFDEDLNMKDNADLVLHQKTGKLVALHQLQKSASVFDQEEIDEEIIKNFTDQLNDISPEDFLDED